VLIRRYQAADREAVWELHNLALQEAGAHLGNGPWDEDLGRIEEVYLAGGGEFLVGVLDGRLAAMGALKRSSAARAEIKRMRVHPDFQRRGLGQAMLDELERGAAALGYQVLHLDTTTRQIAAQKLYHKNGYQVTGSKRAGPFELILFEKRLGAQSD
jgi:ribosomal protein S18 acetylase RimI-like enzyme